MTSAPDAFIYTTSIASVTDASLTRSIRWLMLFLHHTAQPQPVLELPALYFSFHQQLCVTSWFSHRFACLPVQCAFDFLWADGEHHLSWLDIHCLHEFRLVNTKSANNSVEMWFPTSTYRAVTSRHNHKSSLVVDGTFYILSNLPHGDQNTCMDVHHRAAIIDENLTHVARCNKLCPFTKGQLARWPVLPGAFRCHLVVWPVSLSGARRWTCTRTSGARRPGNRSTCQGGVTWPCAHTLQWQQSLCTCREFSLSTFVCPIFVMFSNRLLQQCRCFPDILLTWFLSVRSMLASSKKAPISRFMVVLSIALLSSFGFVNRAKECEFWMWWRRDIHISFISRGSSSQADAQYQRWFAMALIHGTMSAFLADNIFFFNDLTMC